MDTTTIHVTARLEAPDPYGDRLPPLPGSWFITHGQGRPAAGTYTEVAIPEELTAAHPEHVLDDAVRQVAAQLYGTAWAFHYRPAEYAVAVERWGLRRRERVTLTAVDVWS